MTEHEFVEALGRSLGKSINVMAAVGLALIFLFAFAVARSLVQYVYAPVVEAPTPKDFPPTIEVQFESALSLAVVDVPGPGGRPFVQAPPAAPHPHRGPPGAKPWLAVPRVNRPINIAPPITSPPVATRRETEPDRIDPAPTAPPVSLPPTVAPSSAPATQEPPVSVKLAETLADALESFREKLPSPTVLIPFLCLALIVAIARNGIEFSAMAAFHVGGWVAGATASVQNWQAEIRQHKLRRIYGDMNEEEFREEAARRKERIAASADRSEILYEQADRFEYWLNLPFVTRRLRQRAAFYIDAAERAKDELEELERLYADLEQDRRARQKRQGFERVHELLHRLGSDAKAANALAELSRMSLSFDWASLLPDGLPGDVRGKIVKLLRLMAGASTISEARAAYGRVLHLLNSHNATWREMAE